jgi:UDP-3-O-[3-hydroxymyristoyl] glucosamine N-acyltransferase
VPASNLHRTLALVLVRILFPFQKMLYEFNGYRPVVHETAFIHPKATVTGNVVIGPDVYIGPGAAIRGDWGRIVIEAGCNVQENCTIHMFPGLTVLLKEAAHIGHGAVVHGATIGRNCLVGMNAVLMDDVATSASWEPCVLSKTAKKFRGAASWSAIREKLSGK